MRPSRGTVHVLCHRWLSAGAPLWEVRLRRGSLVNVCLAELHAGGDPRDVPHLIIEWDLRSDPFCHS